LLAGCAGGPAATDSSGAQPREYLDDQSGATVSYVARPLVFARERTERAESVRDYVNLTAATVNRGGKRDYVLIAYVWSTLDTRFAAARPNADSLVVVADERQLRLSVNGKTPEDLGIVHGVGTPPRQVVKPLVFVTDVATLRLIAAARSLQVQRPVADAVEIYGLWDDQRKALDSFVRFLDGER
jgi:hypothetical protein